MNDLYLAIGIVLAGFGIVKAVDWAISVKYKTRTDCSKCQSDCRKEIFGHLNGNRDLLVKLNTNMELLMTNFSLQPLEKDRKDK